MKVNGAIFVLATFLLMLYLMDKAQKFKGVTNPLKRRKCDAGGCGHFGAYRSAHPTKPHQGQDFLIEPGEPVFAAISGKVRISPPYKDDPRFSGAEIIGKVYKVKTFYFLPIVSAGQEVTEGDVIGYAQNLGLKFGGHVPNHVHVEVRVGGVAVNPDGYFEKDTEPVFV